MNNTQKLCLSGILIALIIVLSAYCQIPLGASIRLDLGYAIVVFAALYLGSYYGGLIAIIARIINDFIFSGSISFWWAIGSAFFGFAIGLAYKLSQKISNKYIQTVVLYVSMAIISFVSFAGIVPIIASCIGLDYRFMLGIGVIASVADAIVAMVVGYPLYCIFYKIQDKETTHD